MAFERCLKCGQMHYQTDPCRSPTPIAPIKEAVAKSAPEKVAEPSVTNDAPKTVRRGRPKTISDMRAYKAQKERERRMRMKANAGSQ